MPLCTSSWSSRVALGAALVGAAMSLALAATPAEQKAIVQSGASGAEVLKLQTVPVMEPRENEVLIRIHAAAVNPADYKARTEAAGRVPAGGAAPPAIIPGQDAAGIVEKIGSGVTGLKAGDPVWAIIGRRPGVLNGGYAQFALAAAGNVVAKPRNMTYAEAAGLGVAGVTGVRDVSVTKVASGQRVLITGVAGGVGSFAAQAAKARGAYVIGTATAKHNAYLKSIGVDEVVDYSKVKFEEQVKNVDVVIDTVGADTAERAMTTLRKGGVYISNAVTASADAQCAAAGVVCAPRSGAAAAGRNIFEEVGSLAAAGKLKVNIDRTFPLAEAVQAQAYSEAGHAEGKIILIVNAAEASRR